MPPEAPQATGREEHEKAFLRPSYVQSHELLRTTRARQDLLAIVTMRSHTYHSSAVDSKKTDSPLLTVLAGTYLYRRLAPLCPEVEGPFVH